MSLSSLTPVVAVELARFAWVLGVPSMACCGRASEFRTSAGSASCMVSRLDSSLSVMSRAAEKFARKTRDRQSRVLRVQRRAESNRSGADGGAESVGEGLAEALDIGFVF